MCSEIPLDRELGFVYSSITQHRRLLTERCRIFTGCADAREHSLKDHGNGYFNGNENLMLLVKVSGKSHHVLGELLEYLGVHGEEAMRLIYHIVNRLAKGVSS